MLLTWSYDFTEKNAIVGTFASNFVKRQEISDMLKEHFRETASVKS